MLMYTSYRRLAVCQPFCTKHRWLDNCKWDKNDISMYKKNLVCLYSNTKYV